VLATRRAELTRVILPAENAKALRALPESVRTEMVFLFVERIEEVFVAALPGLVSQSLETAA